MKTKQKVVGRIFSFSEDTNHIELEVENKADLIRQVKDITGGDTQAVKLAKLAWTDDHADITIGKYRIACIGRYIRETWGRVPTQTLRKQQPTAASELSNNTDQTPTPTSLQ